jgi:hypothetical protein
MVTGQHEEGFLEIKLLVVSGIHFSFIEGTQQRVPNIRMRFLYLIQNEHGSRAVGHGRFSVVATIARRRAQPSGDLLILLVFAHVDYLCPGL